MTKGKFPFNFFFSIIFIIGFITSCTQEPRPIPNFQNDAANSSTGGGTVIPESSLASIPEVVNFLQMGSQRYTQIMNVFSNYKDSFLVRGNALNQYLSTIPSVATQKYCIVANFPGAILTGSKKVLVVAARIRSYLNFQTQAKEFYLQIEPSNQNVNSSDCSTSGMQALVGNEFATSVFSLKLADVCPNCKSATTSDGIKIYHATGQQEIKINISHLKISMVPGAGPAPESSAVCNSQSECTNIGYNCCLSGQCVNHGQTKVGVNTSSDDYQIAINDILQNPERIINYSNLFYLCPQYVNTDPVDNDPGEQDPEQQASLLFLELQDLYRCVNPQLDEFGICTKTYQNASTLIGTTGYTFFAAADDVNMSTITSANYNNIFEVEYSGKLLYRENFLGEYPVKNWNAVDGSFSSGSKNDTLTSGQGATVIAEKPIDGNGDYVKVRYLSDSTCERVGSLLAKCYKVYNQGQSSIPIRSSDHSGQSFSIPTKANTSYNIIVEIEGVKIAKSSSTWTLTTGSPSSVVFSTSYPVFPGQEVKITYFVSSSIDTLLLSKELAQVEINSHCKCESLTSCNLKPVYNSVDPDSIINYECIYDQGDIPEAPLQTSIYVSSKTVPHKFFDEFGTYFSPENIDSSAKQEGNKFEYVSNSTFKPNNVLSDIGFNEIYGSMRVNDISPMPASVVNVIRGRRYDIFTDEGVFSTCLDCGTDYYANINKLFPNNFIHKGGGYFPDHVESRRLETRSDYRADDLLFGRACFVPATMIPWTHVTNNDIPTQRRNRLAAQHFLFANGYNKDWYGFDYGALIGSFDGVKWFAIGNQRRILAQSNRLFIAVNSYFGDVTAGNAFKVTINEISNVQNSGSEIDHDTESDGAQCQKFHYCEHDNDCLTQLGYDYACENISAIETPWPTFDNSGNELSGSVSSRLVNLVGGSNTVAKRCVYRGKGAACKRGYTATMSGSQSYSKSNKSRFNLCSQNNYCADISTDSTFNTKINRYAQSPLAQNNNTQIVTVAQKTDTVGLSARMMGRPFKFHGDSAAPSSIINQLSSTGITSMCIPGKDSITATTIAEGNDNKRQSADKVLNLGKTKSSTDEAYYGFCPAVDFDGNYTYYDNTDLYQAITMETSAFSIGQSISTNALNLPQLDKLNLFNDKTSPITTIGYNANSCMRSPGSSCFTDMDCAPNKFISSRVRSLSSFTDVSTSEANFWKEELVCARELERYDTQGRKNEFYTVKDHTCCRETEKTFTFTTQLHQNDSFKMFNDSNLTDETFDPKSDFSYINVPGANMSIDDDQRYSRIHSIYHLLTNADPDYNKVLPPLYSATPGNVIAPTTPLRTFQLEQFLTLQRHNNNMCCSGSWVRNFSSGNNGNNGGHVFSQSKHQIWNDTKPFRKLSWKEFNPADESLTLPEDVFNPSTNDVFFACVVTDLHTPHCEVRNIPDNSKADLALLKWFGKFELTGIPQILIESPKHVYDKFKPAGGVDIDDNAQTLEPYPSRRVIDQTFNTTAMGNLDTVADVILQKADMKQNGIYLEVDDLMTDNLANQTNVHLISAANKDLIEKTGVKKTVFSADSFSCCLPTGLGLQASDTSNMCCSGLATSTANQYTSARRCCLDDYVDLSVYTNLYVSSEGFNFNSKALGDDEYDKLTGYIKPEVVEKMAPIMCCSGQSARGAVINEYWVPIATSSGQNDNFSIAAQTDGSTSRRWLGYDGIDSTRGGTQKFSAGVRWNNHVYCVPTGFNTSSSDGSSGAQQ